MMLKLKNSISQIKTSVDSLSNIKNHMKQSNLEDKVEELDHSIKVNEKFTKYI